MLRKLTLFAAVLFAIVQAMLISLSSSSTDLLQVFTGLPTFFFPADSIQGPVWLYRMLVSAMCGQSNSICTWRSLLEYILALFLPKVPCSDFLWPLYL